MGGILHGLKPEQVSRKGSEYCRRGGKINVKLWKSTDYIGDTVARILHK